MPNQSSRVYNVNALLPLLNTVVRAQLYAQYRISHLQVILSIKAVCGASWQTFSAWKLHHPQTNQIRATTSARFRASRMGTFTRLFWARK